MATLSQTKLSFADLHCWKDDDHLAALDVFRLTLDGYFAAGFLAGAETIKEGVQARTYFESFFTPILIEDGRDMLFTGYFEPEFLGSLTRSDEYRFPVHAIPADLVEGQPRYSRRQIEEEDALLGKNLEIAWLRDPVDKYFLQVQGSGRIRLQDGGLLRVGYAARSGHNYTSVGKLLVESGDFTAESISAATIRKWVTENPKEGCALLWKNESYVFFKERATTSPDSGPIGTMQKPITELRSIAIDPDFVPLGSPVWIEKCGHDPLNRLMVAQDTGSAIKGAQRADIFFGSGDIAGEHAGQTNDSGRMIVLAPNYTIDSNKFGWH